MKVEVGLWTILLDSLGSDAPGEFLATLAGVATEGIEAEGVGEVGEETTWATTAGGDLLDCELPSLAGVGGGGPSRAGVGGGGPLLSLLSLALAGRGGPTAAGGGVWVGPAGAFPTGGCLARVAATWEERAETWPRVTGTRLASGLDSGAACCCWMKPEARLRTELGAVVMGIFLGTAEGLDLVLGVGLEGVPIEPEPEPAPAPAGGVAPGPGLPPLEPRGDPLGPPG